MDPYNPSAHLVLVVANVEWAAIRSPNEHGSVTTAGSGHLAATPCTCLLYTSPSPRDAHES
eukprot:3272202-Prymnesium_polylepis.1